MNPFLTCGPFFSNRIEFVIMMSIVLKRCFVAHRIVFKSFISFMLFLKCFFEAPRIVLKSFLFFRSFFKRCFDAPRIVFKSLLVFESFSNRCLTRDAFFSDRIKIVLLLYFIEPHSVADLRILS